MHTHDNNTNPAQPYQPQHQHPPATWPVQGVPPVQQATAPKRGRKTAAWIAGGVVLAVALCCGGAAVVAGGGEQEPVKAKTQTAAPATTAPASTASARPVVPPTTEPEPEPTPDTMRLRVGKTATVTDRLGTVKVTVTKVSKRTTGCKSYAADPVAGYYLVVTVKVQVVAGKASINPLFFTFVDDATGAAAEMFGGILAHCGTPLKSGNGFPKGTKRTGQVVFDVTATKGELVFSGPLGDPRASWTVR